MEARRRQASASASTSHSHDDAKALGKGNGGATPNSEQDDDGELPTSAIGKWPPDASMLPQLYQSSAEHPTSSTSFTSLTGIAAPRRTRNRNPLPPQVGPLFPPLPPRQPKNSPKNSPKTASRSPSGKAMRLASSSALSNALNDDSGGDEPQAAGDDTPSRARAPSMSSLSPPPPADGDEMDVDPPAQEAKSTGGAADQAADSNGDGDPWDAYHRRRGVRSFSGAKSGAVKVEPIEAEPVQEEKTAEAEAEAEAEVDPEASAPAEVEDDTVTAAQNGTEAEEAEAADAEVEGDEEGDAAGDTSTSNGAAEIDERSTKETSVATSTEPSLRNPRKRRGEDQLLLDDHLLPKEMRQHVPIPPRRDKSAKRSEPDEAPKQEPAEEDPPEAEEPEAEEEGGDDVEDDEDSPEITRCVCKREGECFFSRSLC